MSRQQQVSVGESGEQSHSASQTGNGISELAVLPSCSEVLQILAVDPAFVIVNKPAGLLSVPGRHPQNRDCAITRLQQDFPEATVVHRLDFDTSGVMVFARHKAAHRAIARQFQQRETLKVYTALVDGRLQAEEGVVDLPIAPDQENRPKYKICHATGKPSLTRYQTIGYKASLEASRVLLYPQTGRSHQLRLHMQALGHPLLGDLFYAPEAVYRRSERLLLHATRLGFVHPSTGKPLEFTADCPF